MVRTGDWHHGQVAHALGELHTSGGTVDLYLAEQMLREAHGEPTSADWHLFTDAWFDFIDSAIKRQDETSPLYSRK